jgi:hypothetical protein
METAMTILNREAAGGNIKYETMVALPTRDFAALFLDEASREDERRVLRVERRQMKSRSTGKARKAGKASKTRKRAGKRPSKRTGAR